MYEKSRDKVPRKTTLVRYYDIDNRDVVHEKRLECAPALPAIPLNDLISSREQ